MKKLFKQWSFMFAFTSCLDLGEYDFLIIPTVEISLPPDKMVEIVKPSFAINICWGFWGWGVFFIKQKDS